jgi:membrane protein
MNPALLARLFWKALKDWIADNGPSSGAAIAYYTLFALAPVLVLVIALAGLVFGQDAVRGEIVGQIDGLIGIEGATAVQGMLQRAREPREGISASLLGLGGLLFAATGAFLELQAALNRIWRVRTETTGGLDVKSLARRRLRSLGMVVSIAFLLLVSLTVSAAINATLSWLGDYAIGWPILIAVVNQAVSILVMSLMFGALFMVLPDVHLHWRDVAVGALATALLFAIGQRLIGAYLGRSALASPFGAAGTVAVILVWVYYSTQVVLYGAQFTRVWAEHRGTTPALTAGATHSDSAHT